MPHQRINTIAELQAEQDRIVDNMRITRQEFNKSASKTTAEGRDFLFKSILLPLGAVGLGVFVAKKLSENGSNHHEESPEEHKEYDGYDGYDGYDHEEYKYDSYSKNAVKSHHAHSMSSGWFAKLMLVALPVVQQLFLNAQATENTEGATPGEKNPNNLQAKTPAAFLSALVPVVIPMAQQHFLKKSEEANERAMVVGSDGVSRKDAASEIFDSLYKMLPVVLPLVQQYFGAGTTVVEDKKAAPSVNNGHYAEVAA